MYPGSPTSPVTSSMCSPVVAPRCAARGTRRSPRRCAASSAGSARRRSARRSGTRRLGRAAALACWARTEARTRPRRACSGPGRARQPWRGFAPGEQAASGRGRQAGLCQLGTACARRQVHEAQGSITSSTARCGRIYTSATCHPNRSLELKARSWLITNGAIQMSKYKVNQVSIRNRYVLY